MSRIRQASAWLLVGAALLLSSPRGWGETAEDWVKLGDVAEDRGDHAEAIDDYTRAIALNPGNALAYYNRGVVRGNTGDPDGEIADYTLAIQANPEYFEAYVNRGVARGDGRGDYDGEIADETRAIQLKPDDAHAWNNRGLGREPKET